VNVCEPPGRTEAAAGLTVTVAIVHVIVGVVWFFPF